MTQLRSFIRDFVQDESGITSVEYGVLGVLVVAAIAAAMTTFKTDLSTAFTNIGTKLTTTIG